MRRRQCQCPGPGPRGRFRVRLRRAWWRRGLLGAFAQALRFSRCCARGSCQPVCLGLALGASGRARLVFAIQGSVRFLG
eukprot:3557520-Alexandrium_andersonii.AAC.1